MHIHLSARHLKTTPAIYSYVADKIGHLDHIAEDIIGAHVVLWHDETRGVSNSFVVKAHLSIPGPDIYGEEHGPDLYAAIDKLTDKLATQLRKRKTRRVDKNKTRAARTKERAKRTGVAIC